LTTQKRKILTVLFLVALACESIISGREKKIYLISQF